MAIMIPSEDWRAVPNLDAYDCVRCGQRATGLWIAESLRSGQKHVCARRGETVPAMLQPSETVPRATCCGGLCSKNEHDQQREAWRKCNADITAERDELRAQHHAYVASVEDNIRSRMADVRGTLAEMKRRAEAAEERVVSLETRISKEYVPTIEALQRERVHYLGRAKALAVEQGPGIAATKPDNSVAWLDEDLLADDAP